MEYDWSRFASEEATPEEIAESIEDPFSLKFLPPSGFMAEKNRFIALGSAMHGKLLFSVYSATGKMTRVVFSRLMSKNEEFFYKRKLKENL